MKITEEERIEIEDFIKKKSVLKQVIEELKTL